MIKIINSQLNNECITALNDLMDMNIKAGPAFKLMRIIKDISSLIEDKLKMEKKILDKYTDKDENGHPLKVYDEENNLLEGAMKIKDINLFQEEMQNLLLVETILQHEPINFEELGLNDTLKIKDIMKIDFIFT